ncbi:MAG: MotA/TolQ/ExbB proton channel family protein [Bdellovibrionaceae bacterium]|nr:MotA/TolQ/ExbB proton channel family protein [Pseudobdellovibrionaceae bacterium]
MSGMMSVIESVKTSGAPGLLIVGLGAVATFIIIDKYRTLNWRTKEDSGELMDSVKEYLLKDQVGKAITLCDAHKSVPASYVVKAILERSNRDEASMLNAAGLKLAQVESSISKRLDYLPAIANVATLVGLFGTIIGLIMSFSALGSVEGAAKHEALSAGISMAMSTTAMGLAVAIPVLMAFAHLNNRMNKLMDQAEQYGSITVDILKSRLFK